MNKLIITGRLTRDAEQRFIPSGTAVLSFSVANNTGYGDKQKTHYFDCALFGKRAEGRLMEFMKKGQQVVVEGEVSLNTYQKKDGTGGASMQVFVQNVELCGGKSESTGETRQQAPEPEPAPAPDYDDDIPF